MVVKVAISVLNHQAAEQTARCIEHLEAARARAGNECEVRLWLLDNGSGAQDAGRVEAMSQGRDWLSVACNEGNTGFAAGHNRNLRHIFRNWAPDFVWLLNNDCFVDAECLRALLACSAAESEVAVWGATLLEAGGQRIQCAGGCRYSDWLTTFKAHGRGRPVEELAEIPEAPFDYIAGASLWIPVGTLHDGLLPVPRQQDSGERDPATWLNESYFLYFEELDLARRLKPGRRQAWCRRALIEHGTGMPIDRQRRNLAEYHSNLSALKFTFQHQPAKLWVAGPARFCLKFLRHVLRLQWYLVPCLVASYAAFLDWRSGQSGS